MGIVNASSIVSVAILLAAVSFGENTNASPLIIENASTTEATRFEAVYIPNGYDSNDHVQIMAEGWFNDDCRRLNETSVAIDFSSQVIHLKPTAAVLDVICHPAVKHFEAVVSLGRLPAGDYLITQGDDHEAIGRLVVQPAKTDSIDDFVYAKVLTVDFHSELMGAGVFINAVLTTSCMELEDLNVSIADNVIVLQPIVAVTKRGPECKRGEFPVRATTTIDYVKEGRYLLQVRSMNGQAINRIVEIR